jgi:2'-5' RNA ligase
MPRDRRRIFAALDLPERARAALARAASEVAGLTGGRAVPPESLHVTLHFVGAVAADRVPSLAQALGEACAPTPGPLRLRLGGLAGRPSRRSARLCAALLHDEGGGLVRLAERVGASLAAALDLRPAPARPLWPHVTLVRFGSPTRVPLEAPWAGTDDERPFDADRATLYDSVQVPGRPPRYEPVVTVQLGPS